MKLLKILIVDDDLVWAEMFSENLKAVPITDLVKGDYEKIEVVHAKNQAEAKRAISEVNDQGYDIVFLDLRYPVSDEIPLEEDGDDEFQGMKWLSELRVSQPNAAIVIITSHPDDSLDNVVQAIRNHDADEFIPKTEGFPTLCGRIKLALENARRSWQIRGLEKQIHTLLQSRATRTFAEEIGLMLGDVINSLHSAIRSIECGDPSQIIAGTGVIRSQINNIKKEFKRLANLLNEENKCSEVDVVDLVEQMQLLFRGKVRNTKARVEWRRPDQKILINTYEGDLKVALHEVILNAIEALESSTEGFLSDRVLTLRVEPCGEGVVIKVIDNGDGLDDEVKAQMFDLGFTNKNKGEDMRNRGLGLYNARRMMHHLGGRIEVNKREDGGTEATLTFRNLG